MAAQSLQNTVLAQILSLNLLLDLLKPPQHLTLQVMMQGRRERRGEDGSAALLSHPSESVKSLTQKS